MHKMKHLISLMLLGIMTLAVTSCGNSPLDKAIKQALVQQDTTQAQFDSICAIIRQNPDRYKQYLDDKGQVDVMQLQALIDKMGADLRPPIHWNIDPHHLL